MDAADTKALARRYEEEHPREGYQALTDALLAPDCAVYVYAPGIPQPLDREGWKRVIGMFRAALPDMRHTVEDVLAEGDTVAVRWSGSATQAGELLGLPPTGRHATITGISLYRFAGGRIVESRHCFDLLGFLQQLGALPAPGSDGA
jgi:steroid delta-isomerase-like uncharacterized protein